MVEASAEGSTTLHTHIRTMLKQATEAVDEASAGSYLSIKVKLHLSLRKKSLKRNKVPLNASRLVPWNSHFLVAFAPTVDSTTRLSFDCPEG
jgi:hypothetical protein